MGKAKIVSGGEGGLYTVEVKFARERIEAEIEYLRNRIPELEKLEGEVSDMIATLEAERAIEAQKARNHAEDIKQLLLSNL